MASSKLPVGIVIPCVLLIMSPPKVRADCTMMLMSELGIPEACATLAVDGDTLFLGCRGGGLRIVDVSDVSAPSIVGTYYGYAGPVAVRDGVAYIGQSGLLCLDVSDPTNPTVLGGVDLPFGTSPNDIVLQGDYAYLATNLGYLMVVNIQDPSNPAVVGWWLANSQINSVAIQGNRAYTAEFSDGLGVVDISNPASPQLLGRESPDLASYDVAVRDNLACIVDLHFDGFRTIDVSDATNPVTIGGLPDESGGNQSLVMQGNVAYLRSGLNLRAIDLTEPAQPIIVGSYFIFAGAISLTIEDDLVFVVGNEPQRLMIFDICDCNRAINCPADIDGDGKVDPFDSNACMARFGCTVDDGDPICDRCDLDGDGVVNPFDSNAVMAAFGDCP